MTSEETTHINKIISYMRKVHIVDYKIHDDLSISINEDMRFDDIKEDRLPFTFRYIEGSIRIEGCNFTSLVGLPNIVQNILISKCHNLTSLEGCPKHIRNNIGILDCPIDTLEHGPEFVGGVFEAKLRNLTNLHHLPLEMKELTLDDCINLTTLDTNGVNVTVHQKISIGDTPIAKLFIEHDVPYCFNYKSAFAYKLPGIILKFAQYLVDQNGEVDIDMISNLIPEIQEGLK